MAVGGFNVLERTLSHGAEVGGRVGGVDGGACRRLAGDRRGGAEVERARIPDGGGVVLSLAENTFKRVAGDPNNVTSGVHVQGDGLGTEGERQSVIASRSKREGNPAVAVMVEPGGGAGGS
ncbi:unnamed protein product [Cuscuta epithymum]|uniref:Uncharacterized protein n=1 Tax=Cuscuta epithymum TaxID=186058 RepID=A0AAV0CSG4_9ASTE|nr:unnamed protein product [Cuscuta epithymum]